MNEKISVLTVIEQPYNFNTPDGVHKEGLCYKAVIAHYVAGKKLPHLVEVVKMPNQEEVIERAVQNIGKNFDGVVLYDRFGRFCGISG